jgi:hypothetical protein
MFHSFRFVGLAFLVPGVVSPDSPAAFAEGAAYGDIVATPGRAAPIRCPRESGIFALAAYLEREDARIRDVGMR